jgi:tetratricopeptide (TPR) repeat protein
MAQDLEEVRGVSKRVCSLIGPDIPIEFLNETEAYIFLPGADEKAALAWIKDLKHRLRGVAKTSFSFGVSVFPFHGFRKTESLLNSRKALLHTRFFGPDTVTFFDGVSLNISGDIYYGEGDLVRAVREYRRGIELDPDNINLLNSLGGAYAQMNRPREAVRYFERALEIDPKNYMALFNLGVAYLMSGEDLQAIDCFERAVKSKKTGSENLDSDLYLHLGRLYCRAGKYRQAAKLLEKVEEGEPGKVMSRRSAGRGTASRFLGEAYKGLGRRREAIVCLQRATRHNPRDAASLSMLGELYSLENQGDDVALALCRQAVEMDEAQWEHWLRLGTVAFQGGFLQEALAALRESLRRNRKGVDAIFMLGRVHAGLGHKRRAAAMYKKVLCLDPAFEPARAALKGC